MIRASLVLRTASACLFAGALAATTLAQAPQPGPAPEGGPRPQRKFPKPTNLKVLPKDLDGKQVRDIMRHWAGDLGEECSTCHAEYADHRKDERGRPMLDFAKDDKPQKRMARIMYKMTQADKTDYVAKVKDLDKDHKGPEPAELTCGTCHRGKLDPEQYVPPKREERGPEQHPGAARGL